MPPLVSGQRFSSLQEFKNALRTWAIESNFTPHIRDSDANRVRAGCRSAPGCPFRIRCNHRNGVATISTCNDVHTCVSGQHVSQNIKRTEISKIQFLMDIVPQLITIDRDTPVQDIIEAVKEKYGQEIAVRQAQKVKSALCPRPKEACQYCGAPTHRNPASRKVEPCPQDPRYRADEAMNTENSNNSESHFDFNNDPIQFTGMSELQTNGSSNLGAASIQNGHATNSTSTPLNVQDSSGINQDLLNDLQQAARITSRGQAQNYSGASRTTLPGGNGQVSQTPSTPSETRMDAALLMHTAARLMQEAARLNAEAARLNASVANA